MANRKLSPEELAALVNSTPEMRKFVDDLGKSAMLSTISSFIEPKKPKGGFFGRGSIGNALYGTETVATTTSTIKGRSADTIIMDELAGIDIWERESKRLQAEYDQKRAAARRAMEERQAHYKGDPLAGTF
jgi:hypothetical protein